MKNSDIKQLSKANSLLSQALSVAMNSLPNNNAVGEAKTHIKQAMSKLESVQKKQMQRKEVTQSQFETWWGNIKGGAAKVANQPLSPVATQKALSELNKMQGEVQQELDQLESNTPSE